MTIQTKIAAEAEVTNLAPRMGPDAAFRAGLLEATHRAEERHTSLLMRCEAVEAERDALLAKIAKLEEAVRLTPIEG